MIPYAKQLTFLFFGPIWCYNRQTGVGLRRVGYSPFTDNCWVRVSQFGSVEGHRVMERTAFEAAVRDAEKAEHFNA